MKKVYEIIKQLQSTNSSNEKLEILRQHKDNEQLKQYLKYVYDEVEYNYNQTKIINFNNNSGLNEELNIKILSCIVNTLSNRKITGNKAKEYLSEIYFSMDYESRELLNWMILRDCRCGIGPTQINKIWNNLIIKIPYMRCDLVNNVKHDKWNWKEGIYSQIKMDGMFANFNVMENDFSVFSRKGSRFPKEYFEHIYADLCQFVGCQFHGELLIYNRNSSEILTRQEGNGILNSILKGGELSDNHVIKYGVWDSIPIKEAYSKNKYKVPYSERLNSIQSLNKEKFDNVFLVNTRIINSFEEALEHYQEVISLGGEGTIIKNPEGIWEDTTSKNCLKLKVEMEVDLKIIGYNEGYGKNSDTFGSLICESSDKLLEVSVSGFKDTERKYIFDNMNDILGKIITVKSNDILNPGKNNEKYSLFLPRYVEIRNDKSEANTLKEIQDIYDSIIGIK